MHWKLSKWQLPVHPVRKISWHFSFSALWYIETRPRSSTISVFIILTYTRRYISLYPIMYVQQNRVHNSWNMFPSVWHHPLDIYRVQMSDSLVKYTCTTLIWKILITVWITESWLGTQLAILDSLTIYLHSTNFRKIAQNEDCQWFLENNVKCHRSLLPQMNWNLPIIHCRFS